MHLELKNRLRDESVNVPFSVSNFFVAVARKSLKRDKKARRKTAKIVIKMNLKAPAF